MNTFVCVAMWLGTCMCAQIMIEIEKMFLCIKVLKDKGPVFYYVPRPVSKYRTLLFLHIISSKLTT